MSNNVQMWVGLAQNLLIQLPVVFVAGLALAWCLTHWGQMPRACLLGSIGFALVLARAVAASTLQILVPRLMGGDHRMMMMFFTVSGVVWSLWSALAYGLLAAAVFADRSPAPRASAAGARP